MTKIPFTLCCLVGLGISAQARNTTLACGTGWYVSNLFAGLAATPAGVVFGYISSRNYPSRTHAMVLPPLAAGPGCLQRLAEGAAFCQPVAGAAPLPVALTSFTGLVASTDCSATLAWQTAAEHNSYAYEVQSSADGKSFAPLGTVPSKNRAAGAGYTFRAGVLAGTQYFRLRMVGTDGTDAYSPVVTLTATCELAPLLLVPNPIHDYVLVSGLPAGRCQLLVYNMAGQRVAHSTAEGSARLVLSGWPAGVYLLKVITEDGSHTSTTRLVKE